MSAGDGTSTPGVGGSNASEFVRKLYRMLEDPAHQDVARWGKDGDTFVVVENEKFTRSILPKHFKHSNMASFVRQLNKYDFHKVRQTNDSGSAANGANVCSIQPFDVGHILKLEHRLSNSSIPTSELVARMI
jgi:osomolarity two-component system response regulator SKN7